MTRLERGKIYKWQIRGSLERGLLEMWGNGNDSLERRVRDGEEDSSILAVPEAVALADAGNVLLSTQS